MLDVIVKVTRITLLALFLIVVCLDMQLD